MTAQYRPYRDEDSVDALEATSWSDNEPGSVQIYEKTTEELPFNTANKKMLWIQVSVFTTVGILGFLLGYFASYESMIESRAESHEYVATDLNLFSEDPTIKDKILTNVDGNNILATLTKYENTNRIPGSSSDHQFANQIHDTFRDLGFHTTTSNYSFHTMLPRKPSVVKLISKNNDTLYSNIEREKYEHDDMRPFLPLSQATATVISTNQILYVNQGTKEDYVKLASLGVNLSEAGAKMVFVIRQKFYQAHDILINAQENGARAVLVFPDPELFGDTSPFPPPLRLPNDAGRSHPTAWSNYGDLAMYNISSLNGFDTSKLGLEKESKVQIPIIPISFNTASRLLRGLSGAQAPNEWNCFEFTLYIGPGYREENNEEQRDKVLIEFNNEETEIISPTVTGIIAGSVEPDRYIVVGSRRDSLNRGLLDSISGSAIMLELARVFSSLMKQGWRPRRTIIFNSYGAESMNLVSSSHWLETQQRLLHERAVAYLNCDLVVIGNRSASIAASPLLYQTLYNSTEQVPSPHNDGDLSRDESVYETWMKTHHIMRKIEMDFENKTTESNLDSIQSTIDTIQRVHSRLTKEESTLGSPGSILHDYKIAATVKTRPKLRRLDLQSSYSPFFLYAGIPVVDVRYAGFNHNNSGILEDMLPVIGSKYDNLAVVQHIDPHLKYHVTVTKILGEILRDLSDSVFLPFNLLDYAVTLRDAYDSFVSQFWKLFNESGVDLDSLKHIIKEFSRAAVEFHHRQDMIEPKDAMKVRTFNDQLMQLERAFLDPSGMPNYWKRKHIILAPNDGQDSKEAFPGLVDWIALMEGDTLDATESVMFVEILRIHYKALIHTITNAIKLIQEVNTI